MKVKDLLEMYEALRCLSLSDLERVKEAVPGGEDFLSILAMVEVAVMFKRCEVVG